MTLWLLQTGCDLPSGGLSLLHSSIVADFIDCLRFLRFVSKGPSGSDLLWCHDSGSEAGDRGRVVMRG